MLPAGPRRQSLDALRGIAILLVVAWHYLPQPWTPVEGGLFWWIRAANTLSWSGVDLFFVLSGFLIVGILIDNREAANYFRTFYARRFYRIVPLYALVLVFAALSIDWRTMWQPYVAHLIFQQNALVPLSGSWGLRGLEVTWSLAVEEQFYMIAPLVIRFAPLSRLPVLLLGSIVVAPLCRLVAAAVLPSPAASFAAMTLLPCRIDSLAIGGLIAWASRDAGWSRVLAKRWSLIAVASISGTLGMLIPMAAGWAWSSAYMWTVGLSFLAAFYGTILVASLSAGAERIFASLSLRPLVWAGIGAYSIYLFHLAIRDAASVIAPSRTDIASWIIYMSALTAANVAVALCCWKLVERPMIRCGHRHTYRPPLESERNVTKAGSLVGALG